MKRKKNIYRHFFPFIISPHWVNDKKAFKRSIYNIHEFTKSEMSKQDISL